MADLNVLDELSGYHKIVGVKLARVLKGLPCGAEDFVKKLDELSIEIVGDISRYDLLLISRGKFMEEKKGGCRLCRAENSITNRIHFDDIDLAPKKVKVDDFCFMNGSRNDRLKIIYEQKSKKIK